MMARWVVGVVMLAACGRSPVEGNSDDASSGVTGTTTQSSASTGVTATATATVTATDTNDTGGSATQGADDSSGASTEPTPTGADLRRIINLG